MFALLTGFFLTPCIPSLSLYSVLTPKQFLATLAFPPSTMLISLQVMGPVSSGADVTYDNPFLLIYRYFTLV